MTRPLARLIAAATLGVALSAGPLAYADEPPLQRLAQHGGIIDAAFVARNPAPTRWEALIAAAPIRAGAWRAWTLDPEGARRIRAVVDPEYDIPPSVRSGGNDPLLAPVYFDAALHGRGAGEDRAELARFGASLAQDARLLEAAYQAARPGVRAALVAGLHPQDAHLAGPLLRRAAGDPDRYVRQSAISVIGRRPDARLFHTELVAAASDADPVIRMLAVRAIGWHGLTDGLPGVLAALDEDVGELRLAGWTALFRLEPRQALDELLRRGPDPDPWVARQVDRMVAVAKY